MLLKIWKDVCWCCCCCCCWRCRRCCCCSCDLSSDEHFCSRVLFRSQPPKKQKFDEKNFFGQTSKISHIPLFAIAATLKCIVSSADFRVCKFQERERLSACESSVCANVFVCERERQRVWVHVWLEALRGSVATEKVQLLAIMINVVARLGFTDGGEDQKKLFPDNLDSDSDARTIIRRSSGRDQRLVWAFLPQLIGTSFDLSSLFRSYFLLPEAISFQGFFCYRTYEFLTRAVQLLRVEPNGR